MANAQWLNEFQNSEVIFISDETSDHFLGLLNFCELIDFDTKPFRFFDMWATDPSFMTTVEKIWNQPILGTHMYRVSRKLVRLQQPLRKLNREVFGDMHQKYVAAKENLNRIQVQI